VDLKAAETVVTGPTRARAADYVTLTKPRLNMLVIASAMVGFVMGGGPLWNVRLVLMTLVGTALVAGGASAFNQVIERARDARMERTRLRPMADRRLQPFEGILFGAAISATGLALLAFGVNVLSASVAASTLLTYALIYTPLKPHTSFATVVGAVPGALPPVIGWAAATGTLSRGGWVLFGIVFLWQLPHFLAIAWMYREDYARAGFPMLPVIDPDGRSTARQALVYAAALLPMSLTPTLIGMATTTYFVGALILTLLFLGLAIRFAITRHRTDARRLFFGSITYLPLLWILMIAGRT
jgi:protoheme IX farnesyltransferase